MICSRQRVAIPPNEYDVGESGSLAPPLTLLVERGSRYHYAADGWRGSPSALPRSSSFERQQSTGSSGRAGRRNPRHRTAPRISRVAYTCGVLVCSFPIRSPDDRTSRGFTVADRYLDSRMKHMLHLSLRCCWRCDGEILASMSDCDVGFLTGPGRRAIISGRSRPNHSRGTVQHLPHPGYCANTSPKRRRMEGRGARDERPWRESDRGTVPRAGGVLGQELFTIPFDVRYFFATRRLR